MGIEAATSSVTSTAQTTVNSSSTISKANSSDVSFKDEMTKVTNTKDEAKTSEKEQNKAENDKKADSKKEEVPTSTKKEDNNISSSLSDDNDKIQSQNIIAVNNAGIMLSNDIAQMYENTFNANNDALKIWTVGVENGEKSNIKMNESDADFFIQLTQNENINVQTVTAQAQNMVNNGAEFSEVKQNVQVSQALLNALSEARENNQPIRIDFDQNVSVILRVGRDGAISAQFIPGDRAVEQYLRNNIESLRSTFDEQDLPYSELSYSNSSKEQNQRRRQEKQQGE